MSKPALRILQVSTYDIAGGAEKIAWDLFTNYQTLGHQSWLAVGTKKVQNKDVLCIPSRKKKFAHFIQNSLKELPYAAHLNKKIEHLINPIQTLANIVGHEYYGYPGTWDLLNLPPESPNILHCHNLHKDYFDLHALPRLSHEVRVVLTLHDAWLFTGHCAHSFDCNHWRTGCGNCPALSIYPAIRRDATAYNWKRKAQIYRKSQLHVVTPCQWLMNMVDQSILKPGIMASKVIPNGVNMKVFHPTDRAKTREGLRLPHDAKILLFAANGIRGNIWKDYETLRSALKKIAKTEAKVLCLALGEDAPPEHIGNIEIQFIPYQEDPKTVAQYYQAADIYLHPARIDTFPTTVLEALACGTPVVASAVGGIPEQVVEGQTGFLVPVGDAPAMAGRVLNLLADEGLRLRMGRLAAGDAVRRFGLKSMVGEYLAFYDEILKEQ